jgi:CcmD family protein
MDGNYVALAVTLAVWIGLFAYMLRLDRKVSRLESKRKS